MPDIFTYNDSRQFLGDYYEEQKRANPCFSYQYFANRAGLKSKTFIFKVLHGEKTLSERALFAVAQAMKLDKRETDYFEALVHFTQAQSEREREFHFNRMQTFGKNHAATKVRQDQFDYFSTWYLPALREIVVSHDFGEDYTKLARTLNPPITAVQAKKGVHLLLGLGLIQRSPDGRYIQTDTALTTGTTVGAVAVQAFQKENLRLAAEAIDRHDRAIRDISTLTVGISEEGFNRIVDEIARLRKRIAEIADNEKNTDRVYQINFQAFPLSTVPKKG
jgi:uncharacterized protein (TIGR02147 family)